MNRYQIYLDPKSVKTLDELAEVLEMSRSKILRDAISRVAMGYGKVINYYKVSRASDNPLLKMAGFAKSPTGNVSKNIDEIYLKD